MSALFNTKKNTTDEAIAARLAAVEKILLTLLDVPEVTSGAREIYRSAINDAGEYPEQLDKAATLIEKDIARARASL